ncbi:MAG: diguanylate cyclase, partial [Pseudomonadales bacterium]|nr:diguanylate cyclase [Pseudomonadales bacterium]
MMVSQGIEVEFPVRLLVADDNEADRVLLREMLTRQHSLVEVDLASNTTEVDNCLNHRAYDCIILDFNLGIERADEILARVRHRLGVCPVIVVSSSADQSIVISSMRSGSVDFVPKQDMYDGTTLWKRICIAISMSRSQVKERRQRERRQRELQMDAYMDPITGLWNRRYFQAKLSQNQYKNDRRLRMHIVMIDIDHFKAINDSKGHAVGDAVLRSFARIMARNKRGGMTQFRWGGEEFLILYQTASLRDAWVWCEEFQEEVSNQLFGDTGEQFIVTFSAGIVGSDTSCVDNNMIEKADQALYLAKTWGRNRTCTWEMVCMDKILKDIEKGSQRSPIENRNRFVEAFADLMRQTQRDHSLDHC